MDVRTPRFVPWALYLLSACRHEIQGGPDAGIGPTTTRIHVGPVECGDPSREDVRITELELTSRPIESNAGHTDFYWRVTHGCAVKPNPLARVAGTRIVIDPNVEFTGRHCCPIQQTFRTRIPHLVPGNYEVEMGAKAFHVQVP